MKRILIAISIAAFISSCSVAPEKFTNAAKAGDIDFVKNNISSISDDEEFNTLYNALSGAISNYHWDLADFLVDQGANGSLYSLCMALKSQKEDLALKMLELNDELGVELNVGGENIYDGGTPLQYALAYKQNNAAKKLIANRALTSNVGIKFLPPLHIAIETNQIDIIKLIIRNVNTLDLFSTDGNSPLCYAIQKNNLDAVKILLNAGAKKDIKALETAKSSSPEIQALILPLKEEITAESM